MLLFMEAGKLLFPEFEGGNTIILIPAGHHFGQGFSLTRPCSNYMKKVPFLILSLAITSVLVSGAVVYLQRNESSSALNATLLNIPGIAVAAEKGCTACHSLDGAAGIGPSWKGTFGTPRIMTDGSRRMVDDAYLRKSMLEPAAEVVTGFANVMIPPELSEEEITQLIQLIRQLGTSSSG